MGQLQSRREPLGWARWGAPAVVAAVLVLGCASSAGDSPDAAARGGESPTTARAAESSQPAPAQITTLQMREAAPGVRLEVEATGPLVWTQYRDAEGRLVLELPNSATGPGVGDLG